MIQKGILLRYSYFRAKLGGRYCRECLNQLYQLQLQRGSCRYCVYPAVCKNCGEVRNIVADLSPMGRWKLLFH